MPALLLGVALGVLEAVEKVELAAELATSSGGMERQLGQPDSVASDLHTCTRRCCCGVGVAVCWLLLGALTHTCLCVHVWGLLCAGSCLLLGSVVNCSLPCVLGRHIPEGTCFLLVHCC